MIKPTPTERFVAVLEDVLGKEFTDEQRVLLEDAFNPLNASAERIGE